MSTIMVEDSENLEKAIKRFKRMVEKEGIVREFKKREYFIKPSAINHQKKVTLERNLLNKKRKAEKKEY
ncbi:MAG: 30S ribosomal protein S21 [Treponema sp.]|nr:30S ribosomal protein S21 [Treponema sp.]